MKMRKGFTLVELLIVIIIIGILAAAMMLSSGSATASAKASNIISDMRTIKSAALMFWADHYDEFNNINTGTGTGGGTGTTSVKALGDAAISPKGAGSSLMVDGTRVIELLKNTFDNPERLATEYDLVEGTVTVDSVTSERWFVCTASGKDPDGEVKAKLAGRAKSVGLYNTCAVTGNEYYSATDGTVYMIAR